MRKYSTIHLVKSEDINHHGTMFAGRMAEWFVEASFIAAAASFGDPKHIVCLQIHGMHFASPGNRGDMLCIETQLVKAGNTSLTVHAATRRLNEESVLVDGFTTFICVDANGKKMPHGLKLDETDDPEELALREKALNLR